MKKWRCVVCSYVYDPASGDPENGVPPGTVFENIPDDWVCPLCGAGKEEFEAADLGEIFGGGLRKAMMESMGGAGGPGAAGKGDFFQKMDKNGDGKITADEYPRGPEAFDKILQKADKDGDGALSKEEMQASREQMRDRKPRGEGGGKAKEGAKE